MIPAIRGRQMISVATALVAVAIIVIYSAFDPSEMPFPRCMFLTLTGWQCPGCGSQRALHSLLHLDFAAAWHYNAMMVCAIPVVIALFAAQFFRSKRPAIYNFINSSVVIVTVFVIIIAWWILRNLL